MRMVAGTAAIVLAMASATGTASAADHLECASALADPETSAAVMSAFDAQQNVGEALMARRGDTLTRCVADNHWSQDAVDSAVRVLLGTIMEQGMTQRMISVGLDAPRVTAVLTRIVDGLAPDAQRRLADGDTAVLTSDDVLKRLEAEHGVAGAASLTDAQGEPLGGFLAARANTIYYRALFATQ